MTRSPLTPLLLGAVALAMGGCVTEQERSIRIGGEVALPALEREAAIAGRQSPGPSITGASREGWDEFVLLVPIDFRAIPPGPSARPGYAHAPARQLGEFPTASSAVVVSAERPGRVQAEALAAPFWAAIDLLSLPVRGFTNERSLWRSDRGRPLDWRRRVPPSGE